MTAIIGPSGSGKTTLMNYLSGRSYTSNLVKSGTLSINNTQVEDMDPFKHVIGYVTQEDILQEEYTVRQTFEHYCTLRNIANKKQWSQQIIDKLQLNKCADTPVGGVMIRGISGGEKKRTTIGVELISSPSILFLDEPTTGLDANTAFEVMKLMSDIKNEDGNTVISILHQPSNEIMNLFDQVIILSDGMIVFDGDPKNINQRIHKLGFRMPKFSNGVEYLLKAIDRDNIKIEIEQKRDYVAQSENNLDPGQTTANLEEIQENAIKKEVEQIYNQRILSLIKFQYTKTIKNMKILSSRKMVKTEYQPTQTDNNADDAGEDGHIEEILNPEDTNARITPEEDVVQEADLKQSNLQSIRELKQNARKFNQPRNFCFQLCYLTGKAFYLFFKNKISVTMSTVFLFIMNFFIMLLYNDLGDIGEDTYQAILNRQGFMFIIFVMAFFTGVNSTILSLLPKKKVYVKDQHGRYYSKLAFYLSEQLVFIPIFGLSYLLVCVCAFYILKLNSFPDISTLFLFFYFMYVGAFLGGSSLGFLLGSIADNMETASLLIPMTVLPLMICNGFFGNLKESTFLIVGISYISPPKFVFQGLTLNEFQNYQEYIDKCRLSVPCPPTSNEERCYMKMNNPICDPRNIADFYENEIWQNIIACVALVVGFRVLGFIVFVLVNREVKLEEKDNKEMRRQIRQFLVATEKSERTITEEKKNSQMNGNEDLKIIDNTNE